MVRKPIRSLTTSTGLPDSRTLVSVRYKCGESTDHRLGLATVHVAVNVASLCAGIVCSSEIASETGFEPAEAEPLRLNSSLSRSGLRTPKSKIFVDAWQLW